MVVHLFNIARTRNTGIHGDIHEAAPSELCEKASFAPNKWAVSSPHAISVKPVWSFTLLVIICTAEVMLDLGNEGVWLQTSNKNRQEAFHGLSKVWGESRKNHLFNVPRTRVGHTFWWAVGNPVDVRHHITTYCLATVVLYVLKVAEITRLHLPQQLYELHKTVQNCKPVQIS